MIPRGLVELAAALAVSWSGGALAADEQVLIWADAPLHSQPYAGAPSWQVEPSFRHGDRLDGLRSVRWVADHGTWQEIEVARTPGSCFGGLDPDYPLGLRFYVHRADLVPAIAREVTLVGPEGTQVVLAPGLASHVDAQRGLFLAVGSDASVFGRVPDDAIGFRWRPGAVGSPRGDKGDLDVLVGEALLTAKFDGRASYVAGPPVRVASRCVDARGPLLDGVLPSGATRAVVHSPAVNAVRLRPGTFQVEAGEVLVWPDGLFAGVLGRRSVLTGARDHLDSRCGAAAPDLVLCVVDKDLVRHPAPELELRRAPGFRKAARLCAAGCKVQVDVGPYGRVETTEVITGEVTYSRIVEIIGRWRFEPHRVDGAPVRARTWIAFPVGANGL